MSSLKQTPLTCSGHTRPVVFLNYSDITPFGYFLISASKDGKPMLRQGDTGDWIGTFEGHKGATFQHKHIVKCVDFSNDGNYLLTGSQEKILRIFDLEKPDEDPQAFSGHTAFIKNALFKKNGKQIISAADDKTRHSRVTSVLSTVYDSLPMARCMPVVARMEHYDSGRQQLAKLMASGNVSPQTRL
ncbi:STRAP-like protein [Mya arenaria]|uniref:Serine-threonine kinase receptor-associated protein n=1 Tax=Mya arenaria TaxID=6604 RepID=A0ABY7EFY3_MYAAR|nr:STRAP-like protein [Mya arenaria]